MWTRLASVAPSVALCLAGFAAQAQSANESASGLESCFRAARLADATCSKLPNDPAQHVDCFNKARTAQLECLERALSEAGARSAATGSFSETAPPAPPVDAAPPEAPLERPDPKEADRTERPESPVGTTPADEAARQSSPSPQSAPTSVAPSVAEAPLERPDPKEADRTERPESPVGIAPADEAAAERPSPSPQSAPASVAPSVAEAPAEAVRSDSSGKKNDRPAQQADWILSETTSPVDYSPLITAVIRATSDVKDGPNSLAVRCRAQRTELSIRTDGAWVAPRGNDVMVDYQINDQPVVRQPWILSADGKTASYRNDPVELLRSIPEGATLKVAVADKGNIRREATFELAGLSGIRQKVGTTCKWALVTATSSEKH